MIISELIEALELAKAEVGDAPCVIEWLNEIHEVDEIIGDERAYLNAYGEPRKEMALMFII